MANLDFDRLLKLRLVVARFGEMDNAKWWNTQGLLGKLGASVHQRGFPKTHYFSQARVVFEAARHRCNEIFNPDESVTLWNLPADIEEQFDEHWHSWLDDTNLWEPFFDELVAPSGDISTQLKELNLVDDDQLEAIGKLKKSAEGKALQIPKASAVDDNLITLLAAGFSKGEPASPVIPFAKQKD